MELGTRNYIKAGRKSLITLICDIWNIKIGGKFFGNVTKIRYFGTTVSNQSCIYEELNVTHELRLGWQFRIQSLPV
jgi:hypothetical protein